MRKFIFILTFISVCWSAFGQEGMETHYIKENMVVGDIHMIKGMPCVGYHGNVEFLLNYKYLGKEDAKYILLEIVCEKQRPWWCVEGGNMALVKLLGGSSQSMTITNVNAEMTIDKISFALARDKDFKEQALGITEVIFRTSHGSPELIKILIDEENQKRLHKQYLYILAAAHL